MNTAHHRDGQASHIILTDNLERAITSSPGKKNTRRALFIIAYHWPMHSQLDYAFANGLRDRGIDVTIVLCNQIQTSGQANSHCEAIIRSPTPEHDCLSCKQYYANVFKDFQCINLLTEPGLDQDYFQQAPDLSGISIEEAMELSISEIPVFRIAFSTLLTRYRVANLETIEDWRSLLTAEALVSYRIWKALDAHKSDFISNAEETVAFIFNGRFTPYRTAYLYMRKLGINAIVHERGAGPNSYSLELNKTVVDDTRSLEPKFITALQSLDSSKRAECAWKARRKLEQKINGINTPWISFVSSSCHRSLEHILDGRETERRISFFTSSPDEVAYGKRHYILRDQLSILSSLSKKLREDQWQTVVRHHPHTTSKFSHKNKGVTGYKTDAIASSHFFDKSFLGDDEVNSIGVALNSHLCVALTSSICLEIGYVKRKCLIASSSIFAPLFPSRMHLNIVNAGNLPPFEEINAAIQCQPMNTREFEYFLIGAYAFFFINKRLEFSSFGYKALWEPLWDFPEIRRKLKADQRLQAICDDICDGRFI